MKAFALPKLGIGEGYLGFLSWDKARREAESGVGDGKPLGRRSLFSAEHESKLTNFERRVAMWFGVKRCLGSKYELENRGCWETK